MANQISLIRKSTTLHVHLIVLSTFLSHHCITLRFIEEVNKSRWTFFLYEFAYIWQNERLIKKMARKNGRMWIEFLLKAKFWPLQLSRSSCRTLNLGHWRVVVKILSVTVLDASVVAALSLYWMLYNFILDVRKGGYLWKPFEQINIVNNLSSFRYEL